MARKLIDFKGLEKEVQQHANKFNNGNFNKSVRQLIVSSLNLNNQKRVKANE